MENEKELLDGIIVRDLEDMKDGTLTATEYTAKVTSVQQLYEIKAKQAETEKNRTEMWAKVAVEVGLGVGALIFNACWMNKGFKFEQTGVHTSSVFRNLWSKFKV